MRAVHPPLSRSSARLPARLRRSALWLALALAPAAQAADEQLAQALPAAPRPPAAAASAAAPGEGPVRLSRERGAVLLDYQRLDVRGGPAIDLMGFHVLSEFADGLYLGLGGHTPLVKGEYGGFMVFDATVHAERRLWGPLVGSVGASLGGGGGGRSVAQSHVLSGSGGFAKAYVGLGVDLGEVTVGLDYTRIRFTDSAIDSGQFGLFLKRPFSYSIGSYREAGRRASWFGDDGAGTGRPARDSVVVGLDNLFQIDPKGTDKHAVNLVDAQYNHFIGDRHYLLVGASVGYAGIVAYNQVYGGVGIRTELSRDWSLNAQLAVGSGGYAPEKIDTGPGLLVYPKVSAEYRLSDELGLLLSGGYLFAPKGSSKNWTVGAALSYALPSFGGRPRAGTPTESTFSGYRLHVFQQTEARVSIGGRDEADIRMLSVQFDRPLDDRLYLPVRLSGAYNSYLTYPGYGELTAGLGVQTRSGPQDRLQGFAQVLVGTNVHGLIVKPSVGLNLAVSDRLALYAQVGATRSLDGVARYPDRYRMRTLTAGLGVSYRWSLPDR
jgi:hypothetical protein